MRKVHHVSAFLGALLCAVMLTTCAGPPVRPVTEREYLELLDSDLESLQVDFDWGLDNKTERRFAEELKAGIREEVTRRHRTEGTPLSITNSAFIAAFGSATSGFMKEGLLDRMARSGDIDLRSGFWDLGAGNRFHAKFRIEEGDDYLALILLLKRPDKATAKVTVTHLETGAAVYDPAEFTIGSLKRFRVRINDMFAHLNRMHSVQVMYEAPDGIAKSVYRCFDADNPQYTIFYRAYPLPVENLESDLKRLSERMTVHDRDLIRNLEKDAVRLYYELSLLEPKWSEEKRIGLFFKRLIDSRGEWFLSSLKSLRFPEGSEAEIDKHTYSREMIRVRIRGKHGRLFFLTPDTLEMVYDSEWVSTRELARAEKASFNFGHWLPDLWHTRNERLFMEVYAINTAKARSKGEKVSARKTFDRTLDDLKRIGAYFEERKVRIDSVAFTLKIDEVDIASFLAGLSQAPPTTQALLEVPAAAPLHRLTQWELKRFSDKKMTFIKDHDFVYYEVQESDVRSGRPLNTIRAKLRDRFPETYTYPLVFSGFMDKHVRQGMLLPIPRSQDQRRISNRALKELIEAACEKQGYDYPELVFAIIWNECRAGKDNFFRFEAGRLDHVQRLSERLQGKDKERFQEIYGQFSYLLAGSWGPGHILYENAWRLGFRGSPGRLALPEVNIPLIIAFLQASNIGRGASISRISRAYNGPLYSENNYHKRLKKNLERAESVFHG